MAHRTELERLLTATLEPSRFKDYGPNGLQVEGRAQIGHLVCGVTASLALIDAAIEARADAILVQREERIDREDALGHVGTEEARGVVAADAVGGLRQVVGAE